MVDFELFFQKNAEQLCKAYGLRTESWDSRIQVLLGDGYLLVFGGDVSGTIDLLYMSRGSKQELVCLDLSWYVGRMADKQDRRSCVPRNTVLDGWKNNTMIYFHVLQRCFEDLLRGGKQWTEAYRKSEYASEIRMDRGFLAGKAKQYL